MLMAAALAGMTAKGKGHTLRLALRHEAAVFLRE
jgi:hypothetical protein